MKILIPVLLQFFIWGEVNLHCRREGFSVYKCDNICDAKYHHGMKILTVLSNEVNLDCARLIPNLKQLIIQQNSHCQGKLPPKISSSGSCQNLPEIPKDDPENDKFWKKISKTSTITKQKSFTLKPTSTQPPQLSTTSKKSKIIQQRIQPFLTTEPKTATTTATTPTTTTKKSRPSTSSAIVFKTSFINLQIKPATTTKPRFRTPSTTVFKTSPTTSTLPKILSQTLRPRPTSTTRAISTSPKTLPQTTHYTDPNPSTPISTTPKYTTPISESSEASQQFTPHITLHSSTKQITSPRHIFITQKLSPTTSKADGISTTTSKSEDYSTTTAKPEGISTATLETSKDPPLSTTPQDFMPQTTNIEENLKPSTTTTTTTTTTPSTPLLTTTITMQKMLTQTRTISLTTSSPEIQENKSKNKKKKKRKRSEETWTKIEIAGLAGTITGCLCISVCILSIGIAKKRNSRNHGSAGGLEMTEIPSELEVQQGVFPISTHPLRIVTTTNPTFQHSFQPEFPPQFSSFTFPRPQPHWQHASEASNTVTPSSLQFSSFLPRQQPISGEQFELSQMNPKRRINYSTPQFATLPRPPPRRQNISEHSSVKPSTTDTRRRLHYTAPSSSDDTSDETYESLKNIPRQETNI